MWWFNAKLLELLDEVDIVETYMASDDYDANVSWGTGFAVESEGHKLCHVVGFAALDDAEFMKLRDVIKTTDEVGGYCPAALVVYS